MKNVSRAQSIIDRQRRRRPGAHKLVIAALAALALLAALPEGAPADQGGCRAAVEASLRASTEWERSCRGLTCREAIEVADKTNTSSEEMAFFEGPCLGRSQVEVAEKEIGAADLAQLKAEEEALRTRALSKPLKYLGVKTVAHPATCRQACEGASRDPGYTTIEVTAAAYAYFTIKLVRYGRRTERFELGVGHSKATVKVPWTCASPGGAFHYTVSAHSNVGQTLVRRGTFQPVSAARCHWLKHAVQVARERNERLAREGERERAREERERLKQWEGNCRALGDTPAVLHIEGGIVHVCRTPEGLTIEVPE